MVYWGHLLSYLKHIICNKRGYEYGGYPQKKQIGREEEKPTQIKETNESITKGAMPKKNEIVTNWETDYDNNPRSATSQIWSNILHNLSICIFLKTASGMSKLLMSQTIKKDWNAFPSITSYILLKIYKACTQPLTLWDNVPSPKLNKIRRLPNHLAYVISGDFDYINVGNVYLVHSLWMMSVHQCFICSSILIIFKCIHGQCPDYLSTSIIHNAN